MQMLFYYLRAVGPISADLEKYLSRILKFKKIYRKHYLLRKGETNDKICFIQKGIIRLFYEEGKHEISNWFLKEGDVCVSVISFFTQSPSYEYIQALEDTEIWYISYRQLIEATQAFPDFLWIAWQLTQRYYCQSEMKQIPLRMARAEQRYQYLLDNFPYMPERIPAKYLASYLGVSEVRLSNIKNKLARLNNIPKVKRHAS